MILNLIFCATVAAGHIIQADKLPVPIQPKAEEPSQQESSNDYYDNTVDKLIDRILEHSLYRKDK